ncbi:hypothetical protein K2Z84_09670 [Candidatus Binatia bacterium]|nr:hypothetical protein [Candidatus Binatia bacterium]
MTVAARRRRSTLVVALAFLGLAVVVYRAVLPDPRTLVPMPALLATVPIGALYKSDQLFVAATIATNAHKLLHDPAAIADFGFCYPMRASYVLGEHMFGESLLAVPVYAASGDPILTYNAVVVLSVWIAALAMYALALAWTGSVPAAFVAGLLFAFNPARLANPAHPFVHGNLWTPLALLAAERLFTRRRWRDAAALALFLVLQLLESFYQVLALAILGGTFGLYLLVVHRRTLRELAPKLLAVAAVVGAAAAVVLGPYLHARDYWGVLQGRKLTVLVFWREYLPGGPSSVGLVALLLAILGVGDRFFRSRPVGRSDPRLATLCGGILVLWATLVPFRLPLVGLHVPNPLLALAGVVPGLDAVRVLASVRFGVYLVVTLLAAYGVLVLTERLRPAWAWTVALLLALLTVAEGYDPSGMLTTRSAQLVAYKAAPSAPQIALVKDLPPGAVLDLPYSTSGAAKLGWMPGQLMLSAYHQRPLAACYNSFPNPLQAELQRLTKRLPDPGAADALYALGFRTLLVHSRKMGPAGAQRLGRLLADGSRIKHEGTAGGVQRFTLSSPTPVTSSLESLALSSQTRQPDPAALPPATVGPPMATVEFLFSNHGQATFVHPTLNPLALTARWYDRAGALVGSAPARGSMPLALAAGESSSRSLELAVPPGIARGSYRVDVAADAEPGTVLARRDVEVS